MIKNLGNFEVAKATLKEDKNNTVYFIFEEKLNKLKDNNKLLSDSVFTIKANFANIYDRVTGSSKSLENFRPSYNATVIEKLINEGANPVAITNCDELGLGGLGLFSANGPIYNPLDSSKIVGGSSSGAAATINENISFAIASDTGDSVRRPAAFVGKVGFKPSYGAVSRYGLFSYSTSLDTVAWLTNNINDAAQVAKVIYGKDENDLSSKDVEIQSLSLDFQANKQDFKPKKVAVLNLFKFVKSYVTKAFHKVVHQLIKENVDVKFIDVDEELLRCIDPVYSIITYSEATSNLSAINGLTFANAQPNQTWEQIFEQTRSQFDYHLQKRLILGSYYLAKDNQEKFFIKAKKARRVIKQYYNQILNQYDCVIFPSYIGVAPDVENIKNSSSDKDNFLDYILTLANLVGNPSISIPLAKFNNLPFSLSVESKLYDDANLLKYSLYFEDLIKSLTKENNNGN
ncbi:amidase family protein [Mesomycoplasma hyorhinis]|uniref:amidase family protein n=1 Tax=Mesomycoplasma hyorhinis TaxID=2100 RepID=UPI001C05A19C|nr:amidase family protein [Mesomycoplasma hyorhinis]